MDRRRDRVPRSASCRSHERRTNRARRRERIDRPLGALTRPRISDSGSSTRLPDTSTVVSLALSCTELSSRRQEDGIAVASASAAVAARCTPCYSGRFMQARNTLPEPAMRDRDSDLIRHQHPATIGQAGTLPLRAFGLPVADAAGAARAGRRERIRGVGREGRSWRYPRLMSRSIARRPCLVARVRIDGVAVHVTSVTCARPAS